jgi:hypothetical protein
MKHSIVHVPLHYAAIVVVVSALYMGVATRVCGSEEKDALVKSLSYEQAEQYAALVKERLSLYGKGYAYGVGVSALLVLAYYLSRTLLHPRSASAAAARELIRSPLSLLCITAVVSTVTMYFYYTMSPKSDYMILHLDGEEQRRHWMDIYRTKQTQYNTGLLIGLGVAGAMALI